MPHGIAFHERPGNFHRGTYARPRRQVDDPIQWGCAQLLVERLAVGDIQLKKMKALATEQPVKPPVFQTDIVSVVEIIDPHHTVAFVQEHFGDARPNKAGAAGDQIM